MSEDGIGRVMVVGSGPAGYAAGLYLARAELKPLVLAGEKSGGQLMWTSQVENYPGFEKGILGPELMEKMKQQAARFGAEIVNKDVTKVDLLKRPFKVWAGEGEYQAEAVVVATGAEAKMLGVPGEKELLGRGVSTCAVCDAPFYKGKRVVVVGGGDAAMEEALALAKVAKSVTIIHRRNELRASKAMQKKVLEENKDKIQVRWNSEVKEVKGKDRVEGVMVFNNQTKKTEEVVAEGVFLAVGHKPMTEVVAGQIDLDEKGYIITGLGLSVKGVELAKKGLGSGGLVEYPTMTSVEGVFGAGDVVDFRYRQAVTAAGMGVMAALDAEKWLETYE